MTKIYNKFEIKARRKFLRKNMPSAEIVLWSKLKGGQLKDLKFRRQHSVGKYIVDFYCPKYKLAIEVDGMTHENRERYDSNREKYMDQFNIRTVRFNNHDIYNNLDKVLEFILESTPPRPAAKTPPAVPATSPW